MRELKATPNEGKREHQELPDTLRTCFQIDKERIVLSKAFRRLKHKTQVFWTPRNDYFRTRMTHAIEVSMVASTISRKLELNVDLAEAIALGHDLGHTPFGHAGERAIRAVLKEKGVEFPCRLKDGQEIEVTFEHNLQSEKVVTKNDDSLQGLAGTSFPGLNLCNETIDGIRCHPFLDWNENPDTPEGWVVRFADIIAYTNHDYDDFKRYKISISIELREMFGKIGKSLKERIDWMINDVVNTSRETRRVSMSEELRNFCTSVAKLTHEEVFTNKEWKRREIGATNIIRGLFEFWRNADEEELKSMANERWFPAKLLDHLRQEGDRTPIIIDHIAGMTDNYALEQYQRLISPEILDYYF